LLCSWFCCSTPFTQPLCLGTFLLLLAPCSSCSTLLFCSCFRLVLPPSFFLQVWSVEELSKFEFFRPNL
jgi:hypothetical protein